MSVRVLGQAQATMSQIQQQLDVIGHNLANSDTYGYKARQAEFQSLLFQQVDNLTDPENSRGRLTHEGLRVGTGARIVGIHNNMGIGAMKVTDRELDTMLTRENDYYKIQYSTGGANEVRYTRDGAFYLTPVDENNVRIVNREGHALLGQNGEIEFSNNFEQIYVNDLGQVITTKNNVNTVVGELDIVEIIRPRVLEAVGENLFRLPDLAMLGYTIEDIVREAPNDVKLIEQGVIETSNVRMDVEMTQMMLAQRAYQLNARSITTADQMQGLVNQLR